MRASAYGSGLVAAPGSGLRDAIDGWLRGHGFEVVSVFAGHTVIAVVLVGCGAMFTYILLHRHAPYRTVPKNTEPAMIFEPAGSSTRNKRRRMLKARVAAQGVEPRVAAKPDPAAALPPAEPRAPTPPSEPLQPTAATPPAAPLPSPTATPTEAPAAPPSPSPTAAEPPSQAEPEAQPEAEVEPEVKPLAPTEVPAALEFSNVPKADAPAKKAKGKVSKSSKGDAKVLKASQKKRAVQNMPSKKLNYFQDAEIASPVPSPTGSKDDAGFIALTQDSLRARRTEEDGSLGTSLTSKDEGSVGLSASPSQSPAARVVSSPSMVALSPRMMSFISIDDSGLGLVSGTTTWDIVTSSAGSCDEYAEPDSPAASSSEGRRGSDRGSGLAVRRVRSHSAPTHLAVRNGHLPDLLDDTPSDCPEEPTDDSGDGIWCAAADEDMPQLIPHDQSAVCSSGYAPYSAAPAYGMGYPAPQHHQQHPLQHQPLDTQGYPVQHQQHSGFGYDGATYPSEHVDPSPLQRRGSNALNPNAVPFTSSALLEQQYEVGCPPAREQPVRYSRRTVQLLLGQDPWETTVDVPEASLSCSSSARSFLNCKGYITWCRDDVHKECRWWNRCRYAHVTDAVVREQLLAALPSTAPLTPQMDAASHRGNPEHCEQFRHTCTDANGTAVNDEPHAGYYDPSAAAAAPKLTMRPVKDFHRTRRSPTWNNTNRKSDVRERRGHRQTRPASATRC